MRGRTLFCDKSAPHSKFNKPKKEARVNQAIQKLPENAQLQTNQAWESKLELVKKLIAPKATPDEFETFLYQCRKMGLDPLAKQIYFNKYETKQGPKMTIIVSIDGYRLVAARTGEYAGSDTTYDNDKDGKLLSATTTVYRLVNGQRCPFASTAFLEEYYPPSGRDQMWAKMPRVMLAKCAETAALRKAFPNELSGTYAPEEMNQAEVPTQTVTIDIEPTTGEIKEVKHEEPAPQIEGDLWATEKDLAPIPEDETEFQKGFDTTENRLIWKTLPEAQFIPQSGSQKGNPIYKFMTSHLESSLIYFTAGPGKDFKAKSVSELREKYKTHLEARKGVK